MENKSLEEKKKIIYEFICDARYVPMKQKELAVLLQVEKERRPELSAALEEKPGVLSAQLNIPDNSLCIGHALDRDALEDLLDGMGLLVD